MLMESVTLELPVELMRSARLVAEKTGASIGSIIQSSLAHALPPFDDLSAEEVADFASLALLDDAQLWEIARSKMSAQSEAELAQMLDRKNSGDLTAEGTETLRQLQDEYGDILLRSAHVYLLLARRGYQVPMQVDG